MRYAEEKRIRPDILTSVVYWAIILMMLYSIISVRIFGNMGAGFSALPLALYYVLYISFVLAVQKSVYIMVRLRARRSQFLNAETNMQKSMRIFVLAGIALAIIIALTSFVFSTSVIGTGKVYFEFIITAVSLLFLCPQGVIRGYLQGLGYTKPIMIADLLVSAISFVSGGVISIILFEYGKKVNNLFHGDEYSAIYGASGMMIGLMIGSIAGLIQILISFKLRSKDIEEIVKSGAPRYLDNKNDVLTGIRPILYMYASPILMCFGDNIFFNLAQIKKDNAVEMISLYGAFNGRVTCLVVLISFLCCIPFIKSWNRVMARIERDELEGARDRFRKLKHSMLMLLIPVSIGFFVSSVIIEQMIFGKNSEYLEGIFPLGSVMIFLFSVGVFASWLLNHMGKNILVVVGITVSWGIHVIAFILFVYVLDMKILGMALSQIIAFAVFSFMSMFLIFKMLKVRYEFLKNAGIPLISSGIAGLILYAENRIFLNIIGEVLTFVIGVVIYIVVYMLLMVLLRGVRTHELKNIPLGGLLTSFSAKVQHDRFYEE